MEKYTCIRIDSENVLEYIDPSRLQRILGNYGSGRTLLGMFLGQILSEALFDQLGDAHNFMTYMLDSELNSVEGQRLGRRFINTGTKGGRLIADGTQPTGIHSMHHTTVLKPPVSAPMVYVVATYLPELMREAGALRMEHQVPMILADHQAWPNQYGTHERIANGEHYLYSDIAASTDLKILTLMFRTAEHGLVVAGFSLTDRDDGRVVVAPVDPEVLDAYVKVTIDRRPDAYQTICATANV